MGIFGTGQTVGTGIVETGQTVGTGIVENWAYSANGSRREPEHETYSGMSKKVGNRH